MGVTLSGRCRVRAGVSLVEWALDAADLAEKSEAEGRKLRRASNFSRSLIAGGRVRFASRHEVAYGLRPHSPATTLLAASTGGGARESPVRARAQRARPRRRP